VLERPGVLDGEYRGPGRRQVRKQRVGPHTRRAQQLAAEGAVVGQQRLENVLGADRASPVPMGCLLALDNHQLGGWREVLEHRGSLPPWVGRRRGYWPMSLRFLNVAFT